VSWSSPVQRHHEPAAAPARDRAPPQRALAAIVGQQVPAVGVQRELVLAGELHPPLEVAGAEIPDVHRLGVGTAGVGHGPRTVVRDREPADHVRLRQSSIAEHATRHVDKRLGIALHARRIPQ
jgi:hypothetical protein